MRALRAAGALVAIVCLQALTTHSGGVEAGTDSLALPSEAAARLCHMPRRARLCVAPPHPLSTRVSREALDVFWLDDAGLPDERHYDFVLVS